MRNGIYDIIDIRKASILKEGFMPSPVLSKIQQMVELLSYQEQLLLIEYLANHLQKVNIPEKSNFEIELALMAKDVEIQAELDKIDKEFILTENDGTGKKIYNKM